MKFQIKNRFTNEIIVEAEAKTLKEVVEKNRANLSRANLSRADLYGADLSRANLYEANLYEANLYEADLSRADLSWAKIKSSQKEELIKSIRIIIEK
ncbi:MAG: pentapeptide repeat-containing protein [Patescibacteria group bacterium]